MNRFTDQVTSAIVVVFLLKCIDILFRSLVVFLTTTRKILTRYTPPINPLLMVLKFVTRETESLRSRFLQWMYKFLDLTIMGGYFW